MKHKKNNLGFTLIELLITVAIMLSILIISITSITGVDKRKKEEAYRQVKNTIETAAEQYVTSNGYLFKEASNAKIPLKYLIDKGYLNKIVDPRSGETINGCTYVNIVKDGNKIKVGEFKDEISNDCSFDIVTGEEGNDIEKTYEEAQLSYKFLCNGSEVVAKNGWFNQAALKNCTSNGKPSLDLKFTITKDNRDTVSLLDNSNTQINLCVGNKKECNFTLDNVFTENTSVDGTSKTYKIKYKTNKELKKVITAHIDVIPPKVSLSRGKSEKNFSYTLEDNNSGIGWWVATDTDAAPSQWGKKLGNKIFTLTGSINGNINYNKDKVVKKYLYVKDVAGNKSSTSKKQYRTCENTITVDTPNAYYWEFKQHDCGNANGPQNVYYFAEWDCKCDIDELSQDMCEYKGSTKQEGHGIKSNNKTGLREITIKYRNDDNGKSACKSDDRQFEYVKQVCGDITLPQKVKNEKGETEIKYSRGDHGYQWYYNSSKEPYNKFKANGWYHSGAWYNRDVIKEKWKSEVSDNNSNRDNACKAACKARAGYYKRVSAK